MNGFEVQHWLGEAFHETVFPFDNVVQIFALHNLDLTPVAGKIPDHIDCLKIRQIGAIYIDGNAIRGTVRVECPPEKPARRGLLAAL